MYPILSGAVIQIFRSFLYIQFVIIIFLFVFLILKSLVLVLKFTR
jgi:hypothetical protein